MGRYDDIEIDTTLPLLTTAERRTARFPPGNNITRIPFDVSYNIYKSKTIAYLEYVKLEEIKEFHNVACIFTRLLLLKPLCGCLYHLHVTL